MQYKRKRTSRAATRPRKRFRRLAARPRISRMALTAPKLITRRTFYWGNWAWNTAATANFWKYWTFTFSQLQNSGEFTNLFDQYKINGIKVTFRPNYDGVVVDQAVPIAGPLGNVAQMHVVVDPESAVVPSGTYGTTQLNTLLEQGKVRTYNLNKPVSIYFKPKVANQLFGGGTASQFIKAPFCRTTDVAIDHRGFHSYIQMNNNGTTGNVYLDVFVTYYFTVKGIR